MMAELAKNSPLNTLLPSIKSYIISKPCVIPLKTINEKQNYWPYLKKKKVASMSNTKHMSVLMRTNSLTLTFTWSNEA